MTIDFAHNARPTVGVEMELHLVDADSGDLVSIANEVLDELGAGHPDGEHPKAKHELFQSTVEVITGVCDTPAQLRDDLQSHHRRGARPTRPAQRDADELRDAPVCARVQPTDQPRSALPRTRRDDAVAGSTAPHLRHAHPRRRARRAAGHPGDQRTDAPPSDLPGAVDLEPLLRRGGFGHVVGPLPRVRVAPDRRPAAATGRVDRLRGVHEDPDRHRLHQHRPRGLVGHPPASRLRHGRTADVRRDADRPRVGGRGRTRPDPRRLVPRSHRRGPAPPSTDAVVGQAEPMARSAGTASTPNSSSSRTAPTRRRATPRARRHTKSAAGWSSERRCANSWANSSICCGRPPSGSAPPSSLDDVLAMAERGSGTDRQRAVVEAGGTLRDVVDHLVDEFASDTPTNR